MKKIYLKTFVTLTATLASSHVSADSFCGFDEGLIGTKAIGFVSPASLDTHKYETGICELNTFETASENAPSSIHLCTDFKHVPSVYLESVEDIKLLGSDYFLLQAFDAKDLWVQMSLKSGEKKWVKMKYPNPYRFDYQYIEGKTVKPHTFSNHPTQSAIYLQPRLDKPAGHLGGYLRGATDNWIDQDIPLDFFNHDVFKIMEKYELFNPDHIEQAKLATNYGDILDIRYDVHAIIRDTDGREWLETKEYLGLSTYDFFAKIEDGLAKLDMSLTEEESSLIYNDVQSIRSKAGRTIYFPYREPSGTITMVMTSGPDCD